MGVKCSCIGKGVGRILRLDRARVMGKKVFFLSFSDNGGVAEWLKAVVLKTIDGVSRPGVQILSPPPNFKITSCQEVS